MTKVKFTFQVDLAARQPVIISGLTIARTVVIRQGQSKIIFEKDKLDLIIQTLGDCKRWLNSP